MIVEFVADILLRGWQCLFTLISYDLTDCSPGLVNIIDSFSLSLTHDKVGVILYKNCKARILHRWLPVFSRLLEHCEEEILIDIILCIDAGL